MNKTNKNKNKKQVEEKKESIIIDDNLKQELNRYLKIAEGELKIKQKEDAAISELKKKNEENFEKLKILKNQNNTEELCNFSLETLKRCLLIEVNNSKLNFQNQIDSRELKASQELVSAQENKFVEIERHNKLLLEKVKEMNEDKSRVEKEEKKRCEDILKKCEDFKQDVISKFQGTEIETILADNENLKSKLEEYKENTQKITENLELQLKMKENQNQKYEETFKSQITSKFDELKEQTDKFEKENVELKSEYDKGIKKFNKLSGTISKFHAKFDVAKKEFEKSLGEIYKLTKENKELKLKDLSELEKENERTKLQVEAYVNGNRELQDKISKLKEISKKKILNENNIQKENQNNEDKVENISGNLNEKEVEIEKLDQVNVADDNIQNSETEEK